MLCKIFGHKYITVTGVGILLCTRCFEYKLMRGWAQKFIRSQGLALIEVAEKIIKENKSIGE